MRSNEIVKQMLTDSGISQRQLQEMLGLKSVKSVSQYLNRDVKCKTFTDICKALGYKVIVTNEKTGASYNLGMSKAQEDALSIFDATHVKIKLM